MNHGCRSLRKRYLAGRRALAFVGAALLITACATKPASRLDFDATHDFSTYKTFAWISGNPMRVGPVIADPRDSLEPKIMDAIRVHLESKGFQFVDDASSPDFVVSFTVGSRERARQEGYAEAKPGAGRWSWATDYESGAQGAIYTQGVLAIDILDFEERRRVWHGVASRRIDEEHRDNLRKLVDSVVASVLSGFPPR